MLSDVGNAGCAAKAVISAGLVMPEYKLPALVKAYYPLDQPETAGNYCIEVIGKQVLEINEFEAECLRRLPAAAQAPRLRPRLVGELGSHG